jgi:hypothetical protein
MGTQSFKYRILEQACFPGEIELHIRPNASPTIRSGGGHNNPVKYPWLLCQFPEEYKYSSASFYESGKDDYKFLTHYLG